MGIGICRLRAFGASAMLGSGTRPRSVRDVALSWARAMMESRSAEAFMALLMRPLVALVTSIEVRRPDIARSSL
jgi:hypothetical protein